MADISGSPIKQGMFTYRGHDYGLLVYIVAGICLSWIMFRVMGNAVVFPQSIIDAFPFVEKVNAAQDWMEVNIKHITRAITSVVSVPMNWLEETLWELPWVFVLLLFVLPAVAYGGLRLGIFALIGVVFWGMVGMWYESMSTVSLMVISVVFSVVLGVALGIIASQSDRFEAFMRPILDTMQTMPAFVYLIPAIFFFGVGATSAAMAVIIYALPPAVRLTNLGIRQVPEAMIEAAQSYGSTRLQMLWKVQLPQALPSIMLGVNQTIMMALGLAVLAVFVGGGGLGEEVWNAIRRLKVGWSFEGGMCIVFMAILFDRLSYAVSGVSAQQAHYGDGPRFHLLPQKWDDKPWACAVERPIGYIWECCSAGGAWLSMAVSRAISPISRTGGEGLRTRPFLIFSVIVLGLVYFIGPEVKWMNTYPRGWEVSMREPIDFVVNWLTVNPYFIAVTQFIKTFVFLYLLDPLDKFLVGLPWWFVMAAICLVAWASVSLRFALITLVFLFFMAASGLWKESLFTLAATSVSVLICMVVGVPLGIWAAYNKFADSIIRPVLDLMQTMPAFVYLIPVLFFFGGGKTAAVIATVIYSVPAVIRLTTLGLRQLPPEIDEVSNSYGSSTVQTLMKVKLPMASPSIMLGLNQAVVFALAMQAITPLIGGIGLGKEVFDAMNTANFGKGLAGGIGIVLLTIVLDRLTQGWTANQRRALGL